MTQFSFTEDYDRYGQPKTQINIACPRGWRIMADVITNDDESPGVCKKFLATRSETTFAYSKDEEEAPYIKDRVARATTYEIPHRLGSMHTLQDLKGQEPSNDRIIGRTINFYDGREFEGLGEGELGLYGAMMKTQTLVLTDSILENVWGAEDIPVYLHSENPDWPELYPEDFKETMAQRAGFEYEEGFFYSVTEGRKYDFQTGEGPAFGQVKVTMDPLENKTEISYDTFNLLPVKVRDAVGLTTQARYDYRTFQPWQFTDENGNRQQFDFSPLGLPKSIAIMGKEGECVGDESEDGIDPGTTFRYDFFAFFGSPPENRQPVWVRTTKREHHITETALTPEELHAFIQTMEYSDGFGRLIQTRTQAEDIIWGIEDPEGGIEDEVFGNVVLPADQDEGLIKGKKRVNRPIVGIKNTDTTNPNVVVSGWQVYDNKGQVVEKYEPFFSKGWEFSAPGENERGKKVKMHYDPRGQVVKTFNPDGSVQTVIYGVPEKLNDPDYFTPTPWKAYTYDPNDNAGRTHFEAALSYQGHWNTPAHIEIDALGRSLVSVERNGIEEENKFITLSKYDIQGNLLSVVDPLGREALSI